MEIQCCFWARVVMSEPFGYTVLMSVLFSVRIMQLENLSIAFDILYQYHWKVNRWSVLKHS